MSLSVAGGAITIGTGNPTIMGIRKIKHVGRKPKPFPDGSLARLKAAVTSARTKAQLQQAQCLWLRVAHGLSALEVAAAIGWSESNVRRFQARYLREGEAALAGPGRGGRRNQILSLCQEVILLRGLRREHWPTSSIDAQAVQEAYERAAGRRVPPSTVSRMLARHGWRKAPSFQVPAPVGPARVYFQKQGVITKKADTPGRPRFDRFKDGW